MVEADKALSRPTDATSGRLASLTPARGSGFVLERPLRPTGRRPRHRRPPQMAQLRYLRRPPLPGPKDPRPRYRQDPRASRPSRRHLQAVPTPKPQRTLPGPIGQPRRVREGLLQLRPTGHPLDVVAQFVADGVQPPTRTHRLQLSQPLSADHRPARDGVESAAPWTTGTRLPGRSMPLRQPVVHRAWTARPRGRLPEAKRSRVGARPTCPHFPRQ